MSDLEREEELARVRLDRRMAGRLLALLRPVVPRVSLVVAIELVLVLSVIFRPWFIRQVIHFLKTGQRLADPPLDEQRDVLLRHYDSMLSYYGAETGSRMARKHIGWYSKGLPGSAEFRGAINHAADPIAVKAMIRAFYAPLIAVKEAA